MSVVGFDVGSLRAVVSVARAGGVDVICNEVSDRATPCLVSFDSKRRFMGEQAKIQQTSNFRNTVSCLNRLVGRQLSEPEVASKESKFLTCGLAEVGGESAAVVQYRGEEHVYSATELMAMFLGKLKNIAQNETKSAVSDCVISVPVYFTDAQRRAMLDASVVAGLNCLRLINDTTATALCYGLTKNDQFSEKPRTVCFVDLGYSGMKVAVASFTKGNLEIKATAYDANLGGRDFDEVLVENFCEKIQAEYKDDIKSSKRGLLRLRTACEKIKKVLSGITSTKVELETENRDYPLHMTREIFEQLIAPLVAQVEACVRQAIASSGVALSAYDSIEVVGGASRIPAVKNMLTRLFGKEVSTTLNQDEAISRGCAFQCAIESPSFRVREFGIKDIISYPIGLSWDGPEGMKDIEAFPLASNLPSVKPLFLDQPLPIEMAAAYSHPEILPPGTNQMIGKFNIQGTKSQASSAGKVRVDVAINSHGLVCLKKALWIEERIEEVPGADADSAPQQRKVIREHELSVVTETASRTSKVLQKLKDNEFALALNDRYAQELDDSRNALEEYIYETRSKLEDAYKPFVQAADAEHLQKQLAAAEEWLYAEHDAENKEMYVARLAELQKLGKPIAVRAKENEARPHAESLLRQLAETILNKASAMNLQDDDFNGIQAECAAKLTWLDAETGKQAAVPLSADPKLTAAKINEQREKLLTVTSALLAKAKPKCPPAAETPSPDPAQEPTEQASLPEFDSMNVD